MTATNKRVSDRLSGKALTPIDVAKYLQVSRQTVVRLFKAKKIEAQKVGVQWRTTPKAVDNFMSQS